MQLVFRSRKPGFPALGALLLLVLGLGGCEQPPRDAEIVGQVFVVLPSGESLRLASVEVKVFTEADVNAHLRRVEGAIAGRRQALEEKMTRENQQRDRHLTAAAEANRLYQQREAELRAAVPALAEKAEARAEVFTRKMASNQRFIAHVDTVPAPPAGIPSREEFEEYAERRAKWLSMNRTERRAWAEVLTSLNVELEQELEKLIRERDAQLYAWADELQKLDAAVEGERAAAAVVSERMAALQQEIDGLVNRDRYLADLPDPARVIRTDADGDFRAPLRLAGRYAFLARTERRVEGEMRPYQWFIWVEPAAQAGAKLILSNHNLVGSGARENVIPAAPLQGRDETS